MFSFKSLIVEIIFPPGKAVAFSVRSRVLFAILQHSFVGVRWPITIATRQMVQSSWVRWVIFSII